MNEFCMHGLDLPVSLNSLYKTKYDHMCGQSKFYMSQAGKDYKEYLGLVVSQEMKKKGFNPITSGCSLTIVFYMPDRRNRDIDNLLKILCDGLEYGGVVKNDNLIHTFYVKKKLPSGKNKLSHFDFILSKHPVELY